jgi:hypothetical protein
VCEVIDIVIERKPATKARWSKPKIAEIVGPSNGAASNTPAHTSLLKFPIGLKLNCVLAHRAIGDETGPGEAAVTVPGGMAEGDAKEFVAAVDGRPDSTTTRVPTRTRL